MPKSNLAEQVAAKRRRRADATCAAQSAVAAAAVGYDFDILMNPPDGADYDMNRIWYIRVRSWFDPRDIFLREFVRVSRSAEANPLTPDDYDDSVEDDEIPPVRYSADPEQTEHDQAAELPLPRQWAYTIYPDLVLQWMRDLVKMHPAITTVRDWILNGEPLEAITSDRVAALPEVARWARDNGFVEVPAV